jgi:hypothetical protein
LTGVGTDNPRTTPLMVLSDGPSTHHDRPAGVPEFFQTIEHDVSASHSQISDIFSEHPRRSNLVNNPTHRKPESRPFPLDPRAFSSRRDVLAREPARDDVDGPGSIPSKNFCRNVAHIVVLPRIRPQLFEAEHATRIVLALGHRLDARRTRRVVSDSAPAEQAQISKSFHIVFPSWFSSPQSPFPH